MTLFGKWITCVNSNIFLSLYCRGLLLMLTKSPVIKMIWVLCTCVAFTWYFGRFSVIFCCNYFPGLFLYFYTFMVFTSQLRIHTDAIYSDVIYILLKNVRYTVCCLCHGVRFSFFNFAELGSDHPRLRVTYMAFRSFSLPALGSQTTCCVNGNNLLKSTSWSSIAL